MDWGIYLQKRHLIKDLSEIYRKYTETSQKNNLIKKWAKDLYRDLTKEDIQMANKHMKRCSTSHVIREMQMKTTRGCHDSPIRKVQIGTPGGIRHYADAQGGQRVQPL